MPETPKQKGTGKPSYTLDELLAQYDADAPRTEEDRTCVDMVPVGREFGSVKFDKLERRAEAQSSGMHDSDPSVSEVSRPSRQTGIPLSSSSASSHAN